MADLACGGSGIFLPRNLDDPNHVEPADEIRFYAQRVFAAFLTCAERSTLADLPLGQNVAPRPAPPLELKLTLRCGQELHLDHASGKAVIEICDLSHINRSAFLRIVTVKFDASVGFHCRFGMF